MVVSEGTGGAIIAWEDNRISTNYDIYAQRVDASGVVQWTANGTLVCGAIDLQENPRIVSDSAGGAIILWEDNRSAVDRDLYAQRVDSSGTTLWTANGDPVVAITGD